MRALTEDALLICDHGAPVKLAIRQSWVTIHGRRVLVDDDPENRSISGCPNRNVLIGLIPCRNTRAVTSGYSTFVRIDGRPMCLDGLTGLTDGTPPGTVRYTVKAAGQSLIGCAS